MENGSYEKGRNENQRKTTSERGKRRNRAKERKVRFKKFLLERIVTSFGDTWPFENFVRVSVTLDFFLELDY